MSNSVTVTYNGNTIYSTTESAIAKIKTKGTYCLNDIVITLTVGGGGDLPAKDTLENTSWADIVTVSKAGEASNYWNIGDKKTVTYNGNTYFVQIIGFDHDNVSNPTAYGRQKAGITFQWGKTDDGVDAGDAYLNAGMIVGYYPMNSDPTNVGGWRESLMRTTTMPAVKAQLPQELQSVIVNVDKLTSEGNQSTTVETTSDDLWLLSEVEIFGSTEYSATGEGTQYEFYADGASTVRLDTNGSEDWWWERSPRVDDGRSFCGVNRGGDPICGRAYIELGVSFGFCV